MATAGDGKERSSKRQRNNLIQKRLTDDELADFKARAHAGGYKDHREYHTALIRGDADLDRKERHHLIRLLGELGKHGSDMEKIRNTAHSERSNSYSDADSQMFHAARAVVDEVAAKIRELLK